ncbi:hypothetical protein Tco_0642593 [Tanacetum coccineum]
MRELGYSGNIKLLSNVKVDTLPQPWRTFGTIINKCLSGKVTGIDTLRLSRAQILWGLYHQEKVDYVYLLWEDLVFQIENKESTKNKYTFYPRFIKVISNHFMSQDQSIPRRNKVDWHMANDDPILTTMRFIPQHEVVQRYGAILPDYLTNPALKESEAYKTYHDLATGKVQPKPKYVRQSSRTETDEASKPSSTLTEATQMKLAIERSKTQLHISQPSGSGAHEGIGVTPGVPDVPTYESNDEQISWKSSEEEDDDDDDEANVGKDEDDDDDEQTESDNDDEHFVHSKFTTHNDEARQEEGEEESCDPRVQTHSHVESTDDDDDEEVQEGRDVEMTEDQPTNVQTTQVTEDTYVIITPVIPEGQQQSSSVSSGFVSNMLNPRPDTAVSSIPGIVDAYLANKMNESVKTVVQLQSDRLRDESQAKNEDFLNKLDDNIKKIIKDQVKEQVKA